MGCRDERDPRDADTVEVTRSEEQLRVMFERVPYQRVRVVKHIVTEEVTRTFQVRREELRIEPEDVTGAAPVEPWAARLTRDEPLVLTLSEEELTVATRVVPRERVRLWVEDVPLGDQTVQADLRKEQIEVIDETRSRERAGIDAGGQTVVEAGERPAY